MLEEFIKKLENDGEVMFDYEDMHYDIYWSDQGGYMVDVFDMLCDEPIDGGLVTGSAKDAVEFLL